LLHVPTAEQVSGEIEPERSNPSQRLYAETGHSIGHSPVNAILGSAQTIFALSTNGREELSVPGDASSAGHAIYFVVQALLAGRRPEEIQTEHADLRLSRIYAVIL